MKDKSDNTNQTQPTAEKEASIASPKPVKVASKSAKGPVLFTALIAIAMGGGAIWYIQNNQEHRSQHYDSQLQLLVQQAQKNERSAQQALTQVENQSQQLQRLNTQLAHALEQLNDVSTAVQTISDSGTEIMLLNDVEQLASLAQQQLQVGGNVANAIVTLEAAQARLSQANRQNFAVLIQTMNGDLDRLRTASVIDVATLTAQLDRLASLISQAPLYTTDDRLEVAPTALPESERGTTAEVAQDTAPEAAWWQRMWDTTAEVTQKGWESLRHDLGQFVSVRRVDDTAALLISPEQADRLRENLRLRVTMAQLALMTKQPKVWHGEMSFIVKALETRFDGSKALTQRALTLATQLADTDVEAKLPPLDNTLAVIENLKQKSVETSADLPPSADLREADAEPAAAPTEPKPVPEPVPDSEPTEAKPELSSPEPETETSTPSETSHSANAMSIQIQQAV